MGSSNIPVQSERNDRIVGQCTIFFCLRCLIFLKFMFAQDAFLHWVRKKEKKVNKCKKHIAFASVNTH